MGPASVWALRFDLLFAQVLVWIASIGRDAELTRDTHMYFFDRYSRLADHHHVRGRTARARRLGAKAQEHYYAGGGDGPPFAAAMALPRPRQWVVTNAVSPNRFNGPDDAA